MWCCRPLSMSVFWLGYAAAAAVGTMKGKLFFTYFEIERERKLFRVFV
jgi:hypothetical protein